MAVILICSASMWVPALQVIGYQTETDAEADQSDKAKTGTEDVTAYQTEADAEADQSDETKTGAEDVTAYQTEADAEADQSDEAKTGAEVEQADAPEIPWYMMAADFDGSLMDLLSGGDRGSERETTEPQPGGVLTGDSQPGGVFTGDSQPGGVLTGDSQPGGVLTEDSQPGGVLTGEPQSGDTIPLQSEQLQSETEAQAQGYPQLTAADIVRLNGDDAEVIFDDDGRATFIRGRFSPEKVEDYNDAVESLNYVAQLLGLTNGALFFCVYGGIDYTTGYTFYLFLQRDGDVTVVNAAIKVYVDPDGYTAALSCSFDPALGVRDESIGKISAKEAEDVVRSIFADFQITVYDEATSQTGIMQNGVNEHVWSVYTNNPDMESGNSDQPYLQHFISYTGKYLLNLPADTINSPMLQKDDALERRAYAMFEGYEPAAWKGEVTLHDGSKAQLEVPVAKSKEDGKYYLIDLNRKMMVADYPEAVYGSGDYIIPSSVDNSGWEDRELIAMYNIGRAYDYYADHGLRSVDGMGIPILILSGMCTEDGSAIDNACFNGYWDGFGVFAISDINNTVESLDIMAHEFTHGITSSTMGGSAYVNDMGAINEAFSDIMGNLCELTYATNELSMLHGKTKEMFDITGTSVIGSTDDPNPVIPDWRIGEMCGRTYRDMSDPVRFLQPAFVGDAYYCMPTDQPDVTGNDFGGVHENSSLLGNIAWVMNEHGLNYEQQYSLWMTAANMMTPQSDYDDILQALIFARKTYGLDSDIDTWLAEAFAERGMLENSHSFSGTWDGVSFADYNRERLEKNKESKQTFGQEPEQTLKQDLGQVFGQDSEQTSGQDSFGQDSEQASGQDSSGQEAEQDIQSGSDQAFKQNPAGDESVSDSDQSMYGPGTDILGLLSKKQEDDWLAGVSLDADDNVIREGFGRIEINCVPEDMDIVIGAVLLDPYTGQVDAITCHDGEGKFSFLVPEGSYWVWFCVKRGGGSMTELWAYNKGGSYELRDMYTVSENVNVKAGDKITLPDVDL